jgi:hypothetical protein
MNFWKAKASHRINYPRVPKTNRIHSTDFELTTRQVLSSIINTLGKVADCVESFKPPKVSSFNLRAKPQDPDMALLYVEDQIALCNAIVDGANSLSSLYNDTEDSFSSMELMTQLRLMSPSGIPPCKSLTYLWHENK